jgi:hypothetical protein
MSLEPEGIFSMSDLYNVKVKYYNSIDNLPPANLDPGM